MELCHPHIHPQDPHPHPRTGLLGSKPPPLPLKLWLLPMTRSGKNLLTSIFSRSKSPSHAPQDHH